MTEQQSASAQAYDQQQVLQERISAYQQELEDRRAKRDRIQGEVDLLEGRGNNADNQRRSLATVQEEVRVLEQELAALQQQAEDPADPTAGIAMPEFVPGAWRWLPQMAACQTICTQRHGLTMRVLSPRTQQARS
jgi:GAF domain-containing protein